MAHDPKCYELAEHFLGGSTHQQTLILLAEHIQDSIEFWIADAQERHQTGCICADCAGAELTSEND